MSKRKKKAEKEKNSVSMATRKRADGLHIAFTRAHDSTESDKVSALAEAEASLDEDDAHYAEQAEVAYDSGEAKTSVGYSRRYASNYDAVFGRKN